MCEYIKDDGDECGIDSHEGAFCHLHEDSEQSERYNSDEPLNSEVAEAVSGASEHFIDPDDPGICDDCEAPVRRAVSAVQEAKFKPKRVVVEEEFRCNCAAITIGTREFDKSDVPDGWY